MLSTFQRQFSDVLGVTLDRITPDTTLADLGADSLDLVELVMELDEEFDISIPDDVAQRIQTIGDLMRYIEQQRRKPGG
ncbi:MAG: acyl carrier protein [Planctomycetes bacterium]|nr:acyl carrier protein [Planctomycetota bacterium]